MTPVSQTNLERGSGNCFAACIASILDLPVEAVPNFCHEDADADGSFWLERAAAWLAERGWGLLHVGWTVPFLPLNCWLIVSGQSPRARSAEDDMLHAVVGRSKVGPRTDGEGKCSYPWEVEWVHDPHPSGAFIAGDPLDIMLLCRG